jgi:hypothetical protein
MRRRHVVPAAGSEGLPTLAIQRMLFPKRFWAGIADGSTTLTFRRWKSPRVVAGRPYRTPAGRIRVDSIEPVDPDSITDVEALRSGHDSTDALLSELPGEAGMQVYRIEFHLLDEPDPREVLADRTDLSEEDVVEIDRRLDRLDKASRHGAWTRPTLQAIAEQPGTRAPDLAVAFGRETQPFKTDVRKLKNLGLTRSLRIGYELSPRGRAYLAAREGRGV